MAAISAATPPAQQPASVRRLAAGTVRGPPAANGATGSFHETASIQHRRQVSHRDFAYGCGKWCVGRTDRWMGPDEHPSTCGKKVLADGNTLPSRSALSQHLVSSSV